MRRRPGRRSVPRPPSSVISTTSPDIVQCTSVSDASWNTIALVAPARPGERRRQHEREQLVAVGVVAERDRARLVLADRLQHLAERRVDHAVDQQEPGEEDRQHRRSTSPACLRRSRKPNSLPARHRLDAVLAAGERRLQVEEEDHLRERQRDHREVDALAADREQPGDDAEQRGRRGAEQDRELGRKAPDLGRVGRDVAGRAEEHRVAEREQPAEAEQQVEGAGEQREAQRLHQEHRVDRRTARRAKQRQPSRRTRCA